MAAVGDKGSPEPGPAGAAGESRPAQAQRGGVAMVALTLLLALAFLLLHSRWIAQGLRAHAELDRAHLQGLAGRPAGSPPSRPLFYDVDPYLWNHYALQVARGDALRVRRTAIDNHPFGREVHWSSGLSWVLAGAGHLRRALTGEDLRTALERASLAVNPLLLAALLLGSAAILLHRIDWSAAAVGVLGIGGSRHFLTAFSSGGPDHHGLAMGAAFATLLGILLGGAGWTRVGARAGAALPAPDAARRWFLLSALGASVGMWVSAFSQIFVFLAVAAGFLLLLAVGPPARTGPGVSYRPGLWRLWGRTGALASLGFYLLEYFPGEMGLRLEVNHPLYALAWWGGAECMAAAAALRLGDTGSSEKRLPAARVALTAAALLAPVVVLLLGGAQVYVPFDPFMRRLHETILEFQPFPLAPLLQTTGLALLAGVLVVARGALCRPERAGTAMLAFAAGSALASTALVFWQTRWIFAATQSLVVLAVAGLLTSSRDASPRCRRGVLAVVLGLLFALQFAVTSATTLKADRALKDLARPDVALSSFLLARDVADVLREQAGTDEVVALCWGWPGTIMAHEADIRGLSSYYWENRDGLRAAADILLAETDREALEMLRRRGVTHVVLFRGSFLPAQLFRIGHGRDDPAALSRTLGARLARGDAPPWLLPVPYAPLPEELRRSARLQVRIYRLAS